MTENEKESRTDQAVSELLDQFGFLDDAFSDGLSDDYEQRKREYEESKRKQEIEAIQKKSEENLRAPAWFTLDKWEAPVRSIAMVAGERCSIQEAIDFLIAENVSALIAGETDYGKSHLAVAIARERVLRGVTAARGKDPELFLEYTINKYRSAHYHQEIGKRAGVYIFDDAGKKPCASGGEVTEYGAFITTIMDERAEKRLPTIITTRYSNLELFNGRMGDDLVRRAMLQEKRQQRHVQILLG